MSANIYMYIYISIRFSPPPPPLNDSFSYNRTDLRNVIPDMAFSKLRGRKLSTFFEIIYNNINFNWI